MKTRERRIAAGLGGLALAVSLCACGATPFLPDPTPTPAPGAELRAGALSPASIKADFLGDLVVSGAGFDATTRVQVRLAGIPGPLAEELLVTTDVVDDATLHVRFSATQGGELLAPGDYEVRVVRGGESAAALAVHVRPVLASSDQVRSLPKLFLRNGGFLNVYMIPVDSAASFLAPGTEIAGADGLGHANFQLRNVTLTPLAGGAPLRPDFAGVTDVLFDPISEARPLAVALAIDQSGSIATTQNGVPASDPTDERITQAQAFVSRLSSTDQVEVLSFNGAANNVRVVIPFTTAKASLTTGLDGLRTGENGGTPLYDAMIKAVNEVAAIPGSVTRAAIVLTDGRDNGSAATPAQAIAAAQAAGVPIFTIGLGNPMDANSLDKAALSNVSDQTGGRFLYAQDPAALATVFDTISGLLKSTYELDCGVSFDPPLTATGAYLFDGEVVTFVDGTELVTHLAPLNVSVN